MSPGLAGRLPSMDGGSDRTLLLFALTGCPDLAVLDALARLQLTARRTGMSCELLATGQSLAELLDLAGLSAVVGQPVREAEAREERGGVEEVVQVDEPPV